MSAPEANYYLGDLLLQIGRVKDARTQLEQTLEGEPDSLNTLAAMARLAAREDHPAAALACLERAVSICADNGPPGLPYGQDLPAKNQFQADGFVRPARTDLRRALVDAREVFGLVVASGADARVRDRARLLLSTVARMQLRRVRVSAQ